MDILKKTWAWTWERSQKGQRWIEFRIKTTGKGKYGRVLKMSRKPTSDEYSKTLIISGLGIVLIGGIGFVIFLIWRYFADVASWIFNI
ncbi:protein translocase SEC61 complex subunit gamma [Thermoplasmatales archaeon ex4484_6]|nr:MAG: protein translocase SEC61 complex subunit gamma [Thermoplasmatales archaeon ex4484_6]